MYLLDDIEGKLKSLALQHRCEVQQQDGQVLKTIPEGDEKGHLRDKRERGKGKVVLSANF